MEITNKIVTIAQFQQAQKNLTNRTIVFTNGCFDILHYGHVHYLMEAKNLGDILVIGLNSDASIKRLKGESRPINPEHARAMLLASLQFVDFVIPFEEDTPLQLIQQVCPDILVKGNDYNIEDIVGADFVQRQGGKVVTLNFIEGFSTTEIIHKIQHQ